MRKEVSENPIPKFVTYKEIGKRFQVSRQTVTEWVRKGYFRRIKAGRKNLVPLEEINNFINRQLVGGGRHIGTTEVRGY
jgi:excisionase family DNA binding protein